MAMAMAYVTATAATCQYGGGGSAAGKHSILGLMSASRLCTRQFTIPQWRTLICIVYMVVSRWGVTWMKTNFI
uniref:Uncharacterized protein n=1 Tax=Oryza glaberrima TaxID=4538 RepID=I1PDY6_ORYGL